MHYQLPISTNNLAYLVYRCGGQVYLAHCRPEYPVSLGRGYDQERDPDQEALVSQGQVQDVHVGHRLHLGVPQDHVDHQGVAAEANNADEGR